MKIKRRKNLYVKLKQAIPILEAYMNARYTVTNDYKDRYILKLAKEIKEMLRTLRDYIPLQYRDETIVQHLHLEENAGYRLERLIEQAYTVFERLGYYIGEKDNEYAMRYLSMTCQDLHLFIALYIELCCEGDEIGESKNVDECPSF